MLFRKRTDGTAHAVGYVLALAILVVFATYLFERKQSFAVSGVTEYLRVETATEGADDWSLVSAHICIPKNAAAPDEGDDDTENLEKLTPEKIGVTANCDDTYFDQMTFSLEAAEEELTLNWTDDYVLDIRQFDNDVLYIYITRELPLEGKDPQPVFFEQTEIPSDSILYIPVTGNDAPKLALRGYMTLGEPPVRSDAMVVREGQYEIRQDGWRLRKHVVATGDLFPGDRITFEREKAPFWARWQTADDRNSSEKIVARMFVSDLVADVPGFNVVATTDPQFSSIHLTRVGGQPTRIPVGWAQRLTTDPLIAAIATILGLLATILALRNNFFRK